jgi:hypothetical protein
MDIGRGGGRDCPQKSLVMRIGSNVPQLFRARQQNRAVRCIVVFVGVGDDVGKEEKAAAAGLSIYPTVQ